MCAKSLNAESSKVKNADYPTGKPRIYRQIADQLKRLIENNEFPPGSRLPSERDLAQQLQVSRASVREALIALEVIGTVDVKVGNGVIVRSQTPLAPSQEPVMAGPAATSGRRSTTN